MLGQFNDTIVMHRSLVDQRDALRQLVCFLKDQQYHFVAVTPASHARYLAKCVGGHARDLREAFGWNMPLDRALLPENLFDTLVASDVLVPMPNARFRSAFRVATLGKHLLVHSSYPTDDADSVFFGPDSYRFAAFVRAQLTAAPPAAGAILADVGVGAGAGLLAANMACPGLALGATDVNGKAVKLARLNAELAGIEATIVEGPILDPLLSPVDVVIANPPYMVDAQARAYRDGGDLYGAGTSVQMAMAGLERLNGGGRMLLYTGSAIVRGTDHLELSLRHLCEATGARLQYRELDPDVFGEELECSPYRDVERIAVIGAVLTK